MELLIGKRKVRIMQVRRRNQRIELEGKLLVRRMDQGGKAEKIGIEISDCSKTGVGFACAEHLDMGAVYEAYLTIWTKEVLHVFLEIVRVENKSNGVFEYGAIFIGMPEMDASRIETYSTIKNMNN